MNMSKYLSIINEHFEINDYLTVKEAAELDVPRHVLSNYSKEGNIERVSRGVYSLSNQFVDEYELLQKKNKKIVYSYGTALYFHGLSDRVPNTIHVSVPQGYNAKHIKDDYSEVVFHYVKKELFNIGLTEIKSPQGGVISAYDIERCICDIIKDKNSSDIQIYQTAIKGYFSLKEKDLRKLIKYSRVFKIESEIRTYIKVLI